MGRRLERLSAFVQRHVDGRQLPGAVVLLARHGQTALLRAFGAATLESNLVKLP
jgi:hypothetical protein